LERKKSTEVGNDVMWRETQGQLSSGGKAAKVSSAPAFALLAVESRGEFDNEDLRVDVPVSGLESGLDSGPDLVGLESRREREYRT
jgi:hypothetical protein